MENGPHPTDLLVAELLERLAGAPGLAEACSVVLDRVAGGAGGAGGAGERAVVVIRQEGEFHGAGWGIPDSMVQVLLAEAAESPLLAWLAVDGPELFRDARFAPFPDFSPFVALPFLQREPDARGVVLLDAARIDERIEGIHALFRRCGTAIARCLAFERLRSRIQRLDQQRDVLAGVVNVLVDPVLLTDHANDILLTNRRAESLFSTGPDDSEGRRRAVQVNNLLFSSFLTQSVIGTGRSRSVMRDLNLVDPSDGSDLVFEVLSVPLRGSPRSVGAVITVLRDITDLKLVVTELEQQSARYRAAEHRARRERDQLNAILENVGDPILVTDNRATIMLMNREAERLLDTPAASAGRVAPSDVRANDTKFTSLISRFLLHGEQHQVEMLELADPATGAALPVEVISSKILDERGEATAIVSVLHDLRQVVENQRLARELRQLNEGLEQRIMRATEELETHNRRLEWQSRELERASRLKSEFLANMSHELRTPLNVLLGYTSLMRDGVYGVLTDRHEMALDKMYTASTHLLQLINDILDLSKIEAGKMALYPEALRLEEVVAEITETVEPLLLEKPLTFTVDVAADLPPLCTDRTKLKQVLFNLVSNAAKFTESGGIEVRASRAAHGDRVRIVVADTGVGIRPEDLDIIFEDFRQADQSTTKRHSGTGLGLSITRKLVGLLGGTISVESRLGEGAAFTVELPFDMQVAPDAPAGSPALASLDRTDPAAAE